MMTLSETSNTKKHRPWRRRISNQLAAFAAVMLFASTQVAAPEQDLAADTADTMAGKTVLTEITGSQLEVKTTLDQASGNAGKTKTASKSKKRFELNLFRFRR